MNIKKATSIVFSPTDTTKGMISTITSSLSIPVSNIDINRYSKKYLTHEFASDELIIFAVPVYGGRVPSPAVERISKMNGSQTPAVIVVTYGNREYDDALLELKNLVTQNGFVVFAAAAFVGEHSIMHSVAHGRPDDKDNIALLDFSKKFWDKLQNIDTISDFSINVDGNSPYREYSGVPFKPQATKSCIKCGICSKNCPVGAIPLDSPNKTDKDLCISCMRCMKVCPSNARKLNKLMLSVAEKAFAKKCSERKEAKIFI